MWVSSSHTLLERSALGREFTGHSLQEARQEELARERRGSAKALRQAPIQWVPEAARRSGRWRGGAEMRKFEHGVGRRLHFAGTQRHVDERRVRCRGGPCSDFHFNVSPWLLCWQQTGRGPAEPWLHSARSY